MSLVKIPYAPYKGPLDETTWNDRRPFLFTISRLDDRTVPLYDLALALYVNPESVDESLTKAKNVVMTYGGYVEFVWPDELDSISASGSTGGFISPQYGYTAAASKAPGAAGELSGRHGTIAYERFLDHIELFRNNGMIYDAYGVPQIRGRVIMISDRGWFTGHFTSFDVTEEETNPFLFELSWEFKIESTIYNIKPPNTKVY